jgi:hypothetical protein
VQRYVFGLETTCVGEPGPEFDRPCIKNFDQGDPDQVAYERWYAETRRPGGEAIHDRAVQRRLENLIGGACRDTATRKQITAAAMRNVTPIGGAS